RVDPLFVIVKALEPISYSPPVAIVRPRPPSGVMGSIQIGIVACVASVTVIRPVPALFTLMPSPNVATVTPACQVVPFPTTARFVQEPAAKLFGVRDVRLRPALTETRNPLARLAVSVPTVLCTK